jgi:hypothetical protein
MVGSDAAKRRRLGHLARHSWFERILHRGFRPASGGVSRQRRLSPSNCIKKSIDLKD